MRLLVPFAAAFVCVFPVMSEAQTDSSEPKRISVAKSVEELQHVLEVDAPVVVTDGSGQKVKGIVSSVSPPSYQVLWGFPIMFPNEPLTAFWASDSLVNGTLIGVGGGMVAAAFVGGTYGTGWDQPFGTAFALSSLFAVPSGAAIGAIVDGLIRHRELNVVYRPSATKPTVRLSPVLNAKGVSLTLRF
jgi:hypothetical protein